VIICILESAVNDQSRLLVKAVKLDLSIDIIDTSTTLDIASTPSDQLLLCQGHTSTEMSYNTNDPNQQWQASVDPHNQQQLQPSAQQANPNGGGNYQQSQQSYAWTDGNTQGQHHSLQQSWSWQGQTANTAMQSPPAFSPPAMLVQGTAHQQLHHQMHQNAMNHSQQALAHHQQAMNMHQSVAAAMSNMTLGMQQTPQPQITYQSMSPQPQTVDQQNVLQHNSQQYQTAQQPALLMGSQPQSPLSTLQYQQQQYSQQQAYHGSPPTSPAVSQPQLQYPQSIYQQVQSPQSPHPHASQQVSQYAPQQAPQQATQQPPLAQQTLQSPYNSGLPQSQQAIQQEPQDHRFSELDRQRTQDIENMNRAGAEINKRLRDLELNKTSVQSSHEAKDQEVRRLQEQVAAVERQRRQDAERNSQQLAELVRSQVTSPSAQVPAFDMSALERVIRETQTQQLSAHDIERVIEEQVSKRLSGMATKADIQSAGAQMQNALSQVPAGLNEEQVQQAVNRELNSVMQDVTNRVNQQRRVEWEGQQDPQLWQTPQQHVQTEFVIEELPEEITVVHPHGAADEAKHQSALALAGNRDMASRYTPEVGQYGVAYQTLAHNEIQSTSQAAPAAVQYSGGSQYAAIEAGHRQASHMPASSIPNSYNQAAIEAPQAAPNVPGTALTPANWSVPAATDPGNALMPAASGTQYDLAQTQPQYAAAQPAQTYEWATSSANPIGAARPQGKLGAAPAQMPQIAGVTPQLQLEAQESSSTGYPTTGQELVHQSRDLERQHPPR
jgi:hypothetical protein